MKNTVDNLNLEHAEVSAYVLTDGVAIFRTNSRINVVNISEIQMKVFVFELQ